MKKSLFYQYAAIISLLMAPSAYGQTIKYELSITNGSQMPLSPAVIYTREGGESLAQVGSPPTMGFIQLCQNGGTATRLAELRSNSTVKFATQTTAPIMPGETRMVEVQVTNPQAQSIHFETMYGKTKDICGVSSFNAHSLAALKLHVTSEVLEKDHTLLTGAFTEPVVPSGMLYPDPTFCANSMNAISCLRELSRAKSARAQIRFFSGYFPSLVTALEMKYGAADVQTLLFPASGAIQLKLKLKH